MPYARINPTGCGIHRNRAKLRLDFFLNPDDPNYERHHIYVVDTSSSQYKAGYIGDVKAIPESELEAYMDKGAILLSRGDGFCSIVEDGNAYDAWYESLPHLWQNTPFHSHFIYPNPGISDSELKAEIEKCLNYFYAFHQHCWDNNKAFIEEWKKVPSRAGQARCPFTRGKPEEIEANEGKVQNILSRVQEFQVGVPKVPPQNLNIGEKGTITVGDDAIDRNDYRNSGSTLIPTDYEAHGSGVLDTAEIYPHETMGGVKIGTFYQSATGADYKKCRDTETIGMVTAGSPDPDIFTGLDLGVQVKDLLGIYFSSGGIKRSSFGGPGYLIASGDQVTQGSNSSYSRNFQYGLSVLATGDEVSGTSLERSTDDDMGVYWTESAWVELTVEDVNVGYQASDYAKHGFGVHFSNVTIPKGATIKSAFLILTPNASRTADDVKGKITGNLTPDAAVWSTVLDYKNRRGTIMGGANDNFITDAQVDWDFIEDTSIGTPVYTPEFKNIIQEIIDQEDWESGNDIAIWIDDHNDRSDHELTRYRIFAAIEDASWDEPKLLIIYETEAGGWTGKISGVTNPAKVMGVDVANIVKVKGVA